MEANPVLEDLTQFQSFAKPVDLTFNQYLLAGKDPLLVHTGDSKLAGQLVPEVVAALKGRPVSYIFVSHFESDECGGLRVWLDKCPAVRVICSEVTARQLRGFGIDANAVIKTPGETLEADGFELQFVSYRSEMHLWEGLLAFEKRRGVLFSSDLFGRKGRAAQTVMSASWDAEVKKIMPLQIPSPEARSALQASLRSLPVDIVAPGHGPVLRILSR